MSVIGEHPARLDNEECDILASYPNLGVAVQSSRNFLARSYNRPLFCPMPTWKPNATTLGNSSVFGSNVYTLFINTNNTLYAPNADAGAVRIWSQGSISPVSVNLSNMHPAQYSLFVTINGAIYLNSDNNGTISVDRWALNPPTRNYTTDIGGLCHGLFVDFNDTLYCSLYEQHRVVTKSLIDDLDIVVTVAGNGSAGAGAYMLAGPIGIFVDGNFFLYVADSVNDRIQRFASGQINGTTVAGNKSSKPISLNRPRGVALDARNYLYIADSDNHRIIGFGPNGFRCIAGCTGSPGSAADQLNSPRSLSFDSYGNIFVADTNNSRIQKFEFDVTSCGKTTKMFTLSSLEGLERPVSRKSKI